MAEETPTNPSAEAAQSASSPTDPPANPAAGESRTPSESKEHAPSTSEPQSTDFPTANAPDPKAANPETNPNAAAAATAAPAPETADKPALATPAAKKPAETAGGEGSPAKAAKKEKAPAVEDKPFAEFINQDYLPALKNALAKQGVSDVELDLSKQKIPVAGLNSAEECWQVSGRWNGGKRQFSIYFPKGEISGPRAFSCSDSGTKPSTIEPFLIDERKITLDLLVFGVVQRLNAQKWLARN